MNWDDFKIVLAVSRSRSFLGAAKLLRVSHTTVSRRMNTLEERLGTALFVRRNNLCTPTRACERIVEAAIRMETDVHSTGHTLREVSNKPVGPIRLTTMNWIISNLLVPSFPRFTSAFPDIQVYFIGDLYDQAAYSFVPGLSLRFDLQPAKHELARTLASFGFAVYAPVDQWNEALPWVSFNGGNPSFAPTDWMNRQGVPIHDVRLLGNDAGIVHQAIRAGVGKGLIPECLGENDPQLARLSGKKPELTRTLTAIIEPQVIALPRTQVFLEWLKETLGDASKEDPDL